MGTANHCIATAGMIIQKYIYSQTFSMHAHVI